MYCRLKRETSLKTFLAKRLRDENNAMQRESGVFKTKTVEIVTRNPKQYTGKIISW